MNSQADTMRTTTSLPSKLSDKEKWLLNFLQGTDSQQLLTLGKESTTRNYGELAMIDERALAQEKKFAAEMALDDAGDGMSSGGGLGDGGDLCIGVQIDTFFF